MNLDQNFDDYAEQCLQDVQSLQDAFIELYDINSYKNWHYDQGYGIFQFTDGSGPNLYFKYASVGSFSTKTNTWKWSWDNEHTLLQVKRPVEKVRLYGEANNIEQLTQGLIDGDEYTGWAMTAVTAKLLNAIGVYRAPNDHLYSYFAFTNQITDEEFEAIKEKSVKCDEHELARMAFVCKHLLNNDSKGFHEAFESDPLIEPVDDYQGWCNECEKARLKEGEWNDKSMAFADIKIVCEECYFGIKERNLNDRV